MKTSGITLSRILPLNSLLLSCALTLSPATPALGMIISGGEEMNAKAKERAASNLGSAICLLEVFGTNTTLGTGVLIETDLKSNTGLILTAAHFLLDQKKSLPHTVALTFTSNPLVDFIRIYASEIITHPSYAPTRGQDLALLRFKLPKGFSNQPMLLPRGKEALNSGLLFMGGYGRFGHNQPKQGWVRTIEDSVVKRIGRMEGHFQTSEQSWTKRNSIENVHTLSDDADLHKLDRAPFVFELKIDPPRTDLPEVFPVHGDSGGPVFVETTVRPMVLAILSGFIPVKTKHSALWTSTALTPTEVEWISSYAGPNQAKMTQLPWNFKQMLNTLEDSPKRYATPRGGKTFVLEYSTSSLQAAIDNLKLQFEMHLKDTAESEGSKGAKSCAVCTNEASKFCSRCKESWYCSPACQKTHWPLHKNECPKSK